MFMLLCVHVWKLPFKYMVIVKRRKFVAQQDPFGDLEGESAVLLPRGPRAPAQASSVQSCCCCVETVMADDEVVPTLGGASFLVAQRSASHSWVAFLTTMGLLVVKILFGSSTWGPLSSIMQGASSNFPLVVMEVVKDAVLAQDDASLRTRLWGFYVIV